MMFQQRWFSQGRFQAFLYPPCDKHGVTMFGNPRNTSESLVESKKQQQKERRIIYFLNHHSKKPHNVSLLFHVFCFNAKFLATKKKLVVPSFNQHGHGKSVFTPSAWRVAKGGETFALQHLKNYMESLGNAEIWMDFVEKWPSKTRKSYHQQKGSRMVSSNPSFFKGCCC